MRSLCHTRGINPTFVYNIFLAFNHSTRSTAGWQLNVTTQHAKEVKIGEVILKKNYRKKSCFTYLSKVVIREFSSNKIQEKKPEKNIEQGKVLVHRILLSLMFFFLGMGVVSDLKKK